MNGPWPVLDDPPAASGCGDGQATTCARGIVHRGLCVAVLALLLTVIWCRDASRDGLVSRLEAMPVAASEPLEKAVVKAPRNPEAAATPREAGKGGPEVASKHARFIQEQQLAVVEQAFGLARQIRSQLLARQLATSLRIQELLAEKQFIEHNLRRHEGERLVSRRMEVDPVHEYYRLQLATQQVKRDRMARKFVEGTIWLSREDAILLDLSRRLDATPRWAEVSRVLARDPVGEHLETHLVQVEIELAGLHATSRATRALQLAIQERLDALLLWKPGDPVNLGDLEPDRRSMEQ